MTKDLWLIEERRSQVEKVFFEYSGTSSVFDVPHGLMYHPIWRAYTPDLHLFLQARGVTIEEWGRFYFWMWDVMIERLKKLGPPLDRFTDEEAERIVGRAFEIALRETFVFKKTKWCAYDYAAMFILLGIVFYNEQVFDLTASSMGITEEVLVDSILLCALRLIERLRDEALRGPLFTQDSIDQLMLAGPKFAA